jgi:two-component system response regulator PilR (NtrC family)
MFATNSLVNDALATLDPPEAKVEQARILHVDDDPDIRLLISASLRDFGYFVATASSVGEAVQLAKELKFNLCILDVRLPDGTGIELCQRLQVLQPGAPVIYYSAYADEAEQKAALSVCGDAYLKKPVSAEYLEQTVARLLRSDTKH